MAASKMAYVESFRVSGSQPLHAFRQICSSGSKQQVVMIVHQNACANVNFKTLRHFTDGIQKQITIFVVDNDVAPFVSSGQNRDTEHLHIRFAMHAP